ncbi:hypothetical protein I3760_05G188000 [Carya illinoinensis]|uniref:Protein PLANT CADMIUM RESISTANCE 2-like n=1 Tax=Carya illinoinensis TaxID=32201 RepID=A0A8T1QKR4_CARIL|nr:protein PLANT CADMIUM RESISTANCE 2-like [Carya illinoinensis]KAG2708356.1 hypothetical protein I3760_05G188000 [Carya illinoinensis]KAG6655086.1 hypothetical protein CIPAW_05G190900 [Carya illinoinensis]
MYSSSNPEGYDQEYSDEKHIFAEDTTNSTGIPVSSDSQEYDDSSSSRPAVFRVQSRVRGPWSSGLCDCFMDKKTCCVTFWCPCITFGQIAEIVDKGSTSCGANGALYALICCVICCPSLYSCFYRSKMRQQYLLRERPCGDCLVHCFCEQCALCQEHRELKTRGFDMTIGWHGNVEQRSRGVTAAMKAPEKEAGMSR